MKFRPDIGQSPPEPVTGAELLAFFQGFLDGTLNLSVKSAALPVSERRLRGRVGSVTTLVGSNFEEVVMDDTKDVAVFFYAPWCGASKMVLPVVERVAEKLQRQNVDTVVVGKMDLTENDIPIKGVSVRFYPALWLWPRSNKAPPLDYSAFNHQHEDGDSSHTHYELGMVFDFLTEPDHQVREAHHTGSFVEHLFDDS